MKILEKIINLDTCTINWDEVWKIPEFKKLQETEQNPQWHGEGNVGIHTKMVYQAMDKLVPLTNDNKKHRLALVCAALFHDIGKGETTIWDKDKDAWSSPKHAIVGEKMTRRLLWDEDFSIREEICELVRNHMKPYYFSESETPVRDIIRMSHSCKSIKNLLLLKEADCTGSIMKEYDGWKDKLEYMKNFAIEHKCFEEPYKFFNKHSKYKFFNDSTMEYPTELYDDTEFIVYIMVGLPGSGKDTYINKYYSSIPMLCRDNIRTEIGLKGEKPMGNKKEEDEVSRLFNERLLEYGRKKQSFIINNTNLRKLYRTGYQGMLKPYNTKFIYIYVEAPDLETTLERRKGTIPKDVIIKMRDSFEFPTVMECYDLIIATQKQPLNI